MGKTVATAVLSALLLLVTIMPSALFSQDEDAIIPDSAARENTDEFITKIKDAADAQSALLECEDAIAQCKTYEDYEKLSGEINKLISSQKDHAHQDVLNYASANLRVEELAYLTKKNDIDSGRIYMSVSEKYYNEALESLDKAALSTKSKDLEIDIYFLRFFIFKELFQSQKVDGIFNEIADKIASYSGDSSNNLAKLNEISKKFSGKGLADYAMRLKLAYASKMDQKSASAIADDISASADKYFEEGKIKDAVSTYDSYLQLAENYYDKDAMTSKTLDIAEKFFNKGRYKDAMKYYSLYLAKYGTSQMADYCSYRLALSYYNDKDYAKAAGKFEEFLNTYQNSVWFEKGFESLCKLYYETLSTEKSIESLQKLVDTYPRRDTRDYAYLLIGILNYSKADYNKALDAFKKIEKDFPKSAYLYAVDVLSRDMKDINKGAKPSYAFGSKDSYKIWMAHVPINADIGTGEGIALVENKDAKPGEIFVKVNPGSKVTFTINNLEDIDRFTEYIQDKDDESRLPREISNESEKDLVFFQWSGADNGKFTDDEQSLSKTWEAPKEPGEYIITVHIGDLGLVRPPDTGSRKDTARTLTIHATVEQ